jgi:hypothetical protein
MAQQDETPGTAEGAPGTGETRRSGSLGDETVDGTYRSGEGHAGGEPQVGDEPADSTATEEQQLEAERLRTAQTAEPDPPTS